MVAILETCFAYAAAVCTTFILYPYRDYVKIVSRENFNKIDVVQHCKWRYKGMLTSYPQLLLLAAPWGMMYGGFTGAGGALPGACVGSVLYGAMKTVNRTLSSRMSGAGNNYNAVGRRSYSSLIECVRLSYKQYGPLSFLCGWTAASSIALVWHGPALIALERREHSSSTFAGNFAEAFRVHAGLTFLSNPLRNTLRSGMFQRDRPGGVRGLTQFYACEKQVFQEGYTVFFAALRQEGISFFLNGALRTIFKTSLPFGVTYATYRALGGALSPSGKPPPSGYPHHSRPPLMRARHFH